MEDTGGNYLEFRTAYSKVTYKYLLLPVWLIDVTYKKKNYWLLMNGQTGKITGKIPKNIVKYVGAVLLGILLCFLIIMLSGEKKEEVFNIILLIGFFICIYVYMHIHY